MSWFTMLIGGSIGWMVGGPLGAVAGAAIAQFAGRRSKYFQQIYQKQQRGSQPHIDPQHRRQGYYFIAPFTLLGKFAKVDGHVSETEGRVFHQFLREMRLPEEQKRLAIQLFNQGKHSQYSTSDLAQQFYQEASRSQDLVTMMYEMIYRLAMADGVMDPAESRTLKEIGEIFHISESHKEFIHKKYGGLSPNRAYAILDLNPKASDEEIRNAYREKVKGFHPDRIISKGLPEEFEKFASDKFREIQEAWEELKKERPQL